MALEQVERFDTGGRTFGWIGLVACVGLVVVWMTQLSEPLPAPLLTGAVFFGVLFWAVILRPAVTASAGTLVLRNVVETVHIPLAAVEDLALRQVLAVRAGDRKWVATGVGRSLKNSALGPKTGSSSERTAVRGGGVAKVVNAADFVESRIMDLAAEAREKTRVERYSDEQVALGREGIVRAPAWPEITGLAVTLAAFVGSFWL